MIRITSKREGFRRCGVAHSKAAVDWPDDRFSEEELAKLKAESMLLFTQIQEAPPEEPSAEGEAEATETTEYPEGHKYPDGHKSGAGEEKDKEKAPVPRNKGKGKR